MERWQFLIQKEGDRLWTPINGSTGELEEGRYRMMAHSSQANFEVDIRITYQAPQSTRPLSQIQSCCRRTNGQGLIMLLPFTYLEPGIWELKCYGDLMSELSGQGWHSKVKLQVSSKIRHSKPLAETASQSSQPNSINETNTQDKAAYYLQKLEDLLRHKIEPMLNSFQIEPITTSTTNFTQQSSDIPVSPSPSLPLATNFDQNEITSPEEDSQPPLKIVLHQNEFNRNEGEPIFLSGIVQIESHPFSLSEFKGKLRYKLQEPETKQSIINVEQLIEENTFPFIFRYALEIPSEWEIEFLTGEVILERVDGIELDRQSLTITTDLKPYLSNPINYTITLSDPEEKASFAFDLLINEEILTSSPNIDLPQPSKMAGLNRSFRPSEGQILPPKISRNSDSTPSKTPKLPQFRKPQLNQVEVEKNKHKLPETAPIDYAFQSLEVQERFLERLSSLAGKANS